MSLGISWSPRAENEFAKILEYIEKEWNNKVTLNFIDSLDAVLSHLTKNPSIYPLVDVKREIHKCVLNKQTTMYYRIKRDKIEIITLFDTRQNPDKLNL